MKTIKSLSICLVGTFAIMVLICSCSTLKTLVAAQPARPAVTNADGTITLAVPAVAAVTTNVPNETVGKIVSYGNSVVVPFIPAPWNSVAGGVLALLGLGAGAVAGIKNKQLNTSQAVVATVVQGVEAAGTLAASVKAAIAKKALSNGTADAVHAAVAEHAPTPSV